MKFRKPAVIVCAVLSAMPAILMAQGAQLAPQDNAPVVAPQRQARAAGQNQRRRFMALVQQLNLSADQQSQLKVLMQTQRHEFMELKRNPNLSADEEKQQAQQIQKQVRQQFIAMLTPEQQIQVKQMMQQAKRQRRNQQLVNGSAAVSASDEDSNSRRTTASQPSPQELDQILASFVSDDDAPAPQPNTAPAARKSAHSQ